MIVEVVPGSGSVGEMVGGEDGAMRQSRGDVACCTVVYRCLERAARAGLSTASDAPAFDEEEEGRVELFLEKKVNL